LFAGLFVNGQMMNLNLVLQARPLALENATSQVNSSLIHTNLRRHSA